MMTARFLPVAMVVTVFALTFLATFRLGSGWVWDIGNGLGFLAVAGLAIQMFPAARTGIRQRHELLGYWVLALAFAHGFWLLAVDGVVRFYLMPGAPFYMWAGLVALIVLSALALMSHMPERRHWHKSRAAFRRLHRALSVGVIAATGLHVTLSRFYLSRGYQVSLFVLLLGTAALAPWWMAPGRPARALRAPVAVFLSCGGLAGVLFVLIRNAAP